MRKRSIYILFTFIVIILFNNKLDALVCTYKNPDDPNDPSKDLVIDFSTNYKNQAYIGGEAGSRDWFKPLGSIIPYQTCIDPNTSTFKEIHLYDVVLGGKTGFFSFAGRNWTFKREFFEGSYCINNINTYEEDASR